MSNFLLSIDDEQQEKDFKDFVKRITGCEFKMRQPLFTPKGSSEYGIRFLEVGSDFRFARHTIVCGKIGYKLCHANKRFKDNIYKFMDWYENEYLVTKNLAIIKHIPHSSLDLPQYKGQDVFSEDVSYYVYKMADTGVEEFFKDIKGKEVKALYSRLFCDVERLKYDAIEPMAKFGQGYMYTKTYDGKDLPRRIIHSEAFTKAVVDVTYNLHHALLNIAVEDELEKGKDVIILDLHSFSDELADSIGQNGPYPDICIGLNEDFNNEKLLNLITKRIKEKGYSYKINFPYSGSIVPTKVRNGTLKGNVYSVKIVINKRLFL